MSWLATSGGVRKAAIMVAMSTHQRANFKSPRWSTTPAAARKVTTTGTSKTTPNAMSRRVEKVRYSLIMIVGSIVMFAFGS